ncbi:MAG: GAF domain-containing sensor histidine kinase [Candidatus Paceibacterota bacterium]
MKNELLGIKTLLTQVIIVLMSIILVVDIILLSDDPLSQVLKTTVLITFLYFSREMVTSVKKEKEAKSELEKAYGQINHYVDQLEEMNTDLAERNDDLKALLEASGKASEALDPKKIAQDIVNSIPKNLKHLGYIGGMIALYDKDTKIVRPYTITQTKLVERVLKLLDRPFEKNKAKIGDADNMISKTIIEQAIFSGDSLAEFVAPTVKKSICDVIQKILKAHSIITIPLISRGRANGIILFMGKRSIKEVAQRDKDMLYMFSSHVGGAIENAKLYEQTNQQVKEMEKLNKKLESANENLKELLEMKNEFLHITSHQLRTPLTAIRGMLSMWYEGDFDNLTDAERRDILKRIYTSTERLNNITNDMLDALEIEGGLLKFQFENASVANIVKETVDTLKNNYDAKGLYIKFSAEENLPEVKVELNYIRQVFMNVVDNASKYTKKGGVEITVKQNGKYIETVVKDTGVGASKDDQKRLFEKFTRGKNAVKENASGSGLGLFIAKKIVEKHHGKMSFFSEGLGMGSTVTIDLPAKKEGIE